MNGLKIAQNFLKNAYDFSSVQLQIPYPEAQEILNWSQQNIPDQILASEGREDDIHITIKYGIHIYDFTMVRNLFINEKPIKVVLGKISTFNNDEHDVVKIDIQSPDLHRLNNLINNNFEITNTHDKYIPHLTLAYVLKPFGEKFNGRDDFLNREIICDSVVFSGKDNRRTLFKLNNVS